MTVQELVRRLVPLFLALGAGAISLVLVLDGFRAWVAVVVGAVLFLLGAVGLLTHREKPDPPRPATAFAEGNFDGSTFEDNESEGSDYFIRGQARHAIFRRNTRDPRGEP